MKKLTPNPHQLVARDFLAARHHALLADEPGLEKTLSLILATEAVGARRVLVTCPASVRTSWAEHVLAQRGSLDGWRIVSYNEASRLAKSPGPDDFDVWIGDEIHFCKTLGSQRTKAIFGNGMGLARRARYKWPATGTWAPNGRPVELYPVLKALHSAFAGMTFGIYAQRYCGAFWDGRGLNVKGATRLDELARLLDGFMLRRTEREVYPDRVAPLVHRVPVELSRADLMAVVAAEEEIGGREARLSSRCEDYSQLGDTSRLLRLLGMAKMRHVAAYVDDLLETTDKVVVFAHHTAVLNGLWEHFNHRGMAPAIYAGGTGDAAKAKSVAWFQGPACRVFVGQDQAAGTGINGLQTVCSTAVFAEPSWTPGDTMQRIRRLARTGQKEPLVNAHLLYAKGTLDDVVVNVHDRKEETGERLMAADPLRGLL